MKPNREKRIKRAEPIKAWAVIIGEEILFPLFKTQIEANREVLKKNIFPAEVRQIEIKIINPSNFILLKEFVPATQKSKGRIGKKVKPYDNPRTKK